jgi:hypothetical protein
MARIPPLWLRSHCSHPLWLFRALAVLATCLGSVPTVMIALPTSNLVADEMMLTLVLTTQSYSAIIFVFY